MTIIEIYKREIFDRVQAETVEKIFSKGAPNSSENELRAEFSFIEDYNYWFNQFFTESVVEISEKLKVINIRNATPVAIGDVKALFSIDIQKNTFSIIALVEEIKKYLTFKIVARWFLYKEIKEIHDEYYSYSSNTLRQVEMITYGLWNKKHRSQFYAAPEDPEDDVFFWEDIHGEIDEQLDLVQYVKSELSTANIIQINGNVEDCSSLLLFIKENLINPHEKYKI